MKLNIVDCELYLTKQLLTVSWNSSSKQNKVRENTNIIIEYIIFTKQCESQLYKHCKALSKLQPLFSQIYND